MTTVQEVEKKYCDNCCHLSYCHRPCTLVISALYDLACEQELLQMCKENDSEKVRRAKTNEQSKR